MIKKICAVLSILCVAISLTVLTACEKTCEHNWKDATCTVPKTCSLCGETEGNALGHTWKEATCTDPKTCSLCGETEGNALGHKVSEYEVILEPSCTAEGMEQGVCSFCGETVEREIAKTSHVDDNTFVVTKNPTTTSTGYKATHCSVCGVELKTETFDLSLEEKNAIKTAESYLSYTSFSRSGLIEQLEYEGFSNEAATLAVDSITVDWNEQAAKEAESYLSYMSFSRSGLIKQLEFEGFTHAQAEYGVSAVGY